MACPLLPRMARRAWAREPARPSPSTLAAGEREELLQLAEHLFVAALADALRHAVAEVAAQEHLLELLDRALHRVGLLQDVDAVGVVLHHLADAAQVALDVVETLDRVVLRCLHVSTLPYPYPPGGGLMK